VAGVVVVLASLLVGAGSPVGRFRHPAGPGASSCAGWRWRRSWGAVAAGRPLLTLLLGLGYATVVLGLGRLLPQGSSLGAVVDQTAQPTRASLWLRPPPGGNR
jgi:hypothetical protein